MSREIKVLVVDDEADFRELMTIWLKSKGYSVISASNGQIAVQLVKEESPDIVFLDLNMPIMNGIEALKRIREFNKDIPVVIISAYVDERGAKEASAYGISGVFYKGTDFEEGLSLLESALRTHKKLKE
jgi:two-component system response regulator (stage 0 sporulation protein F)